MRVRVWVIESKVVLNYIGEHEHAWRNKAWQVVNRECCYGTGRDWGLQL